MARAATTTPKNSVTDQHNDGLGIQVAVMDSPAGLPEKPMLPEESKFPDDARGSHCRMPATM
jgi:hypothetical protein